MMEQIKRVNVSEETFKSILNMIMNEEWQSGQKLPSENELKDMLGVSRHTVRSALNNLNMLGIVETRHGDGNYVKSIGMGLYMNLLIPHLLINDKNLDVIMEFRQGIEIMTARCAALRATDEDIKLLKNKYELCERSLKQDNYLEVDLDFHYTIAQVSKNDLLIQSMYVVKNFCFGAMVDFVNNEFSSHSFTFHNKILDAIIAHDADLAGQYMNNHMKNIIDKIKSYPKPILIQ